MGRASGSIWRALARLFGGPPRLHRWAGRSARTARRTWWRAYAVFEKARSGPPRARAAPRSPFARNADRARHSGRPRLRLPAARARVARVLVSARPGDARLFEAARLATAFAAP